MFLIAEDFFEASQHDIGDIDGLACVDEVGHGSLFGTHEAGAEANGKIVC